MCAPVHKREREEVKNESVAEQSQYRGGGGGGRINIVRKQGVSSIT